MSSFKSEAGAPGRLPARGPMMQNEANFGRSSKRKVSSVKCSKPGFESSESSYFKLYTSNFRRNASRPRAIVRNEPNWAGRAGPRRAKYTKRTQFCLPGRGRRGARREGNRAKQSQLPPWKVSGEDAQPTKSRAPIVRNEPNLPGGAGWRGAWGDEGRIVQNEPNLGEVSSVKSQVSSRSVRHRIPGVFPHTPIFHHFTVPVPPGPMVRNEPNLPGSAGRDVARGTRGVGLLPRSSTPGLRSFPSRYCRTKPISQVAE